MPVYRAQTIRSDAFLSGRSARNMNYSCLFVDIQIAKRRFCPMTPVTQKPLSWRTLFVSLPFLVLVPGFVLADSPSPTPAATPAPEGKISLDATAHRRVPNTVADVTLAIQLDGRTADAVSTLLAQRSQTLLDFLREQGVERLRTENVSFAPQIQSVHTILSTATDR